MFGDELLDRLQGRDLAPGEFLAHFLAQPMAIGRVQPGIETGCVQAPP